MKQNKHRKANTTHFSHMMKPKKLVLQRMVSETVVAGGRKVGMTWDGETAEF